MSRPRVETTRRELEQHLVVDADDVGLTVRIDLTELDTQRPTQPGTQMCLIFDAGCFGLSL
jgi:hypothetical protein